MRTLDRRTLVLNFRALFGTKSGEDCVQNCFERFHGSFQQVRSLWNASSRHCRRHGEHEQPCKPGPLCSRRPSKDRTECVLEQNVCLILGLSVWCWNGGCVFLKVGPNWILIWIWIGVGASDWVSWCLHILLTRRELWSCFGKTIWISWGLVPVWSL